MGQTNTPNLYLGLVHSPILNKRGKIVTTSVTNLDIHDIARSCRTFGVKRYFIVTPLQAQQELVARITGHWESDVANDYNPDRVSALDHVQVVESIEKSVEVITGLEGGRPLVAVTAAQMDNVSGYEKDLWEFSRIDNRPILLLFGTGWGLPASILDDADFRLERITGIASDNYNHLSVRSAVAIYLDRLARSL